MGYLSILKHWNTSLPEAIVVAFLCIGDEGLGVFVGVFHSSRKPYVCRLLALR